MTRKLARSCNPSTHQAERGPLQQVDQPGLYYETLSSPKRLKKIEIKLSILPPLAYILPIQKVISSETELDCI